MSMTWRSCLAAGLAVLMAAPGPAFAGQVMAVVPQSASAIATVGTFGLASAQAAPGFLRDVSLGSLSGSLQATTLLTSAAPAVKLSAALAVVPSAVVPTPLSQAAEIVPAAARASAKMDEARSVLAAGVETGGTQKAADPAATKGVWDAFWSRNQTRTNPADASLSLAVSAPPASLAASQAQPEEKFAVPGPALVSTDRKSKGWLRKLAIPASLAALLGAARVALPSRLPGFWTQASPYVTGTAVLLATYAVNGVARRAVGILAARLHWKPGTAAAVRLVLSVAVYAAGGAVALHTIGISTAALLATFGIGGVVMTMAAKDFIGNFLEGVRTLLNRPFVIGDRIQVGAQQYTVRDMDLRYLWLARPDGAVTLMTYSQFADKIVTVFREYSGRSLADSATGLSSLLTAAGRRLAGAPRQSLIQASLWTALGLGLAVSLPFFPALLPAHALATACTWLPYAKGAVTLLASRLLEKGAVGFIRRLAEDHGWRPQVAVVLKLGAQLGIYLTGGSVALRFFGMTWSALLKSLGATSIALGWASGDIIGNLIQGFWMLISHPFAVGDVIEIGTVSGTVVDMNLNYVVLRHPDASHSLVPYAALRASPFTVLPKAPAQ
jgi:small-conductance mechanosensitive channel